MATKSVCASGCDYNNSQLQTALNAASCGDTIRIEGGVSYNGPFHLPAKTVAGSPCTTYTTLTRIGTLPEVQDVIELCYQMGPTFQAEQDKKAAGYAIIKAAYETNAPSVYVSQLDANEGRGVALYVDENADYWKIQGLEVEFTGTVTAQSPSYGLIAAGLHHTTGLDLTTSAELPDHLIIDRCSIHGTVTGQLVRGVLAQANNVEITNNLMYDCHYTDNDSQCIMSYNGEGPFLIENNYLSGAGENILFGGSDPQITNLTPSNIIQTRNYMTKEWEWYQYAADFGYVYGGIAWYTKNVTECKNCNFNYVYENIIENCWAQNQNGGLILFQSVKDGPNCSWCNVRDIEVYNNVCRNGGFGVNIGGKGCGVNGCASQAHRINIHHNLFYNILRILGDSRTGGGGGVNAVSGSSNGSTHEPFEDLIVNHNTFDNESAFMNLQEDGGRYDNLVITNNIGRARSNFAAIAMSCGCNGGTEGFDIMAPTGYTVSNNVIATPGVEFTWPTNTWFERALGDEAATLLLYKDIFVDRDTMNYSVDPGSLYKAGAARDAIDNTDLGVDLALLPEGSGTPTPPAPANPHRLHGRFGR